MKKILVTLKTGFKWEVILSIVIMEMFLEIAMTSSGITFIGCVFGVFFFTLLSAGLAAYYIVNEYNTCDHIFGN